MAWYHTEERGTENKEFIASLPDPATLDHPYSVEEVIENLLAINGKEWTGGDKHRVYVDLFDLLTASGGHLSWYKTGNISSAANGTIDGDVERIANGRAARTPSFYYNPKTGRWNQNGGDAWIYERLGWVLRRLQGKPEDKS